MQTQMAKGPGAGDHRARQSSRRASRRRCRWWLSGATRRPDRGAEARVAAAPDAVTAARHQTELDLLTEAQPHLAVGTDGLPTLAAPKLQKVYERMASVAKGRETLLRSLGM